MSGKQQFQIHVDDSVLSDLRERLARTRFATDVDNDDMKYGLSTEYIRGFVDHWLNNYDWRQAEAEMNTFDHFRATIDDTPVHFIYKRSKNPNAIPIIMSHGWPWTFWMWRHLIGPLTDPEAHGLDPSISFDVILPSLPGFAFSTPVTRGDLNYTTIPDIFHKLMTETLGYEKYAAAGSDYGAVITSQLGHKYADSLLGIHLGQALIPIPFTDTERPWDFTGGARIPEGTPEDMTAGIIRMQNVLASHIAVHMLDAQTLAHAFNDSPVGMLAWILRRWTSLSDKNADFDQAFSKDEILTHAMIYWVTESIGSSMRVYKSANLYPWSPTHDRQPQIEAPAGFTFLVGEVVPPLATLENRVATFEAEFTYPWYNVVFARAHEHGGHYGPWENPEAWIGDLRENFTRILAARRA